MPAQFLLELEKREKERTGIPNLRVAYNSVHGYYIEVTQLARRQGAGRLPPPADAEERRALHHAGAEDLRGQGAVGARPRARAGEVAVRGAARRSCSRISACCRRSRAPSRRSTCCAALPRRRCRRGYARPQFTDEIRIEIEGGRHPVVEAQIENFIANDCRLSPDAPLPADHRPEHGRQVDLHAPGGADRAAGARRLVRAGARARASARSTRSSRASARPTTSPAGARPSWWR